MTRKREALVRSLQRKMLRAIVGVRRTVWRPLPGSGQEATEAVMEDGVCWIRRATHEAERLRRQHHIPDWVEEISRRKFRWAGHVARREDGRWTRVFLEWSISGCRSQGRPLTRWSDSITKYFGGYCGMPIGRVSWIAKARDRDFWLQIEDDYVKFCARGRR